MVKNKTLRKTIGNILMIGLLINTLPATLPLKAQLPKLSREEVKDEIRKIKKAARKGTILAFVIPGLILAGAAIVALIAFGIHAYTKKKWPAKIKVSIGKITEKIEQTEQTIRGMEMAKSYGAIFDKGEKFLKEFERRLSKAKSALKKSEEKLEKIPKKFGTIKSTRKWSNIVALAATFLLPIGAFLTLIGISGDTIAEAFDSAERLERMEKEHPGTLTEKQNITVARLKKIWMAPVPRGIIKYFTLKSALKKAANKALATQGKLVKKIGLKKTRKNASRYIKLKMEAEGLQASVNEIEKQYTARELKQNRFYKKGRKQLKKKQNALSKLEAKHPSFKNIQQSTIDEYGKKVANILEEFEKPVVPLLSEKEAPEVVPL